MIKTKVMDMTNPEEVEAVEIAYYLLFSSDLQCIEQKTTPEREHLTRPDVIVVLAYDESGVVGACMIDNNSVLFPVMRGNYEEVLYALMDEAYRANNEYLEAYTENELILTTAQNMGFGVQRDGNKIWKGIAK